MRISDWSSVVCSSDLMSTCFATLNAATTLITLDFVQPYRPAMTQGQLVRTGRIATLVITLLAASWAPMIQHFQGLWMYLQPVFAFVASPLVAIFLMGLWMRSLGANAPLRGQIGQAPCWERVCQYGSISVFA